MSRQLIDRSPDLHRLRDYGYHLDVRAGFLLVHDVPYVNCGKQVRRGTLVMPLDLAGDVTAPPSSHVAYFAGEHPCRADGAEIAEIKHGTSQQTLAEGVVVEHSFSAKPPAGFPDYYAKVITYAAIISGPAQTLDSSASPRTFPVMEIPPEEGHPFCYYDSASSRARIVPAVQKLALARVAIVGIGGTGSYVLDLVAKTPVKEIHLYDGDTFYQHNAFRSPGAPSIDTLRSKPTKAEHFTELYRAMHRGIIAHPAYIDSITVDELREMSFVFLCIDGGAVKLSIIEKLEDFGVSFCDVGMGVELADGVLGGILRVTVSTPEKRDHVRRRVSDSETSAGDDYRSNIQIADLNALNAAIAVIKWKKLFGFYRDLKQEHSVLYTIDTNQLLSEDLAV